MADNLNWVFELVDKLSAPANAASKSIKSLEIQMDAATKAVVTFEDAQKKAQGSSGGWKDIFKGNMATKLVDGAKGFAEGIFDAAVSFGKMTVNSLMYKENTLVALKSMLGSSDEADKMFKMATDFARLTPFDTNQVIDSFKSLLASGFKKEEVPILFQAIGDAKALGGDKADMDTMTRAMMRMKAEGKANMRELMELATGSGGAASMNAMYEAVAKNLHKTKEEVMEMERGGKLTGDEAILGFLDVMKNKSGQVGTAMLAANATLSGIFSNLRNTFNDMSMSINSKKLTGLNTFKEAMLNITDLFNANTPAGQRFMEVIERVVNALGGMFAPLTGKGGPEKIISILNTLVDVFEFVVDIIGAVKDSFMDSMGPLGEVFGLFKGGSGATETLKTVLQYLAVMLGTTAAIAVWAFATIIGGWNQLVFAVDWGYLWDEITGTFQAIWDWIAGVPGRFYEFGKDIVMGIVNGISGAASFLMDAIGNLAAGSISAFKNVLGIHSPSTVFEGFGENTSEGYVRGLDNIQPKVDASISGMGGARPSGGHGLGSGVTVNMTLNIDAHGNDGEAIARQLNDILPTQMATLFEQYAMELGVG